jgi:uncharacterized membrane protein YjjB (DUF3815 family)
MALHQAARLVSVVSVVFPWMAHLVGEVSEVSEILLCFQSAVVAWGTHWTITDFTYLTDWASLLAALILSCVDRLLWA